MTKDKLLEWVNKELKSFSNIDCRCALHNDMWWAGYKMGQLLKLEEIKKIYYNN